MVSYLLLRDNVKFGPFSLEELKLTGIRPTDMLWIDGKSSAWQYPDEIEGLQAFIHNLSGGTLATEGANPTFKIKLKDQGEGKINPNQNGLNSPTQLSNPKIFQIEKKPEKTENNYTERTERSSNSYNTGNTIKIIIADDHTLFREGVALALSQKRDIKIVGEAENGMQLLQMLKYNMPDVVLLDIQMPIMDGITTLSTIRNRYPDLKVVILTMYNDSSMVSKLMGIGANAYLTKTANAETMYDAIKTCYSKSYYFNDLTNRSILERIRVLEKMGHAHQSADKQASSMYEVEKKLVRIPDSHYKSASLGFKKLKKEILVTLVSILILSFASVGILYFIKHSTTEPAQVILESSEQHSINSLSAKTLLSADSEKLKSTVTNRDPRIVSDSLTIHAMAKAQNAADSSSQNCANLIAGVKKEINLPDKAGIKNDIVDKKLKDGYINPNSIDSGGISYLDKIKESKSSKKGEYAKKNIHHLVTAFCNKYQLGKDGGISNILFTIYNQSVYHINDVSLEVKYLMPDLTLVKTEIINIGDISPLSSKALKAPNSSKGVKVEYQIISIKSTELGL